MNILKFLERIFVAFSSWIWGTPLLLVLVGGGLYLMIYSRFIPFRYFSHALNVLRGKYDDPDDPGDINHFQALSSALAATVGMGNISGVAVAIYMGGPGALFWMWVSAFVGIATKFFTCTLSILYRGEDSQGNIQGGTMYMITEGLGRAWKPLAVIFAIAGLVGPLPVFQANQLTQILRDVFFIPGGLASPEAHFTADFITGLVIAVVVSLVIFGGIKRIGRVASKMVPFMVVVYVLSILVILAINYQEIPFYFGRILTEAFTGKAAVGGTIGSVIMIGIQRAAFSNEAGVGTATLAHGAAKTKEPVREGLVAMMGPAIDTLLVCTMTALAILVTGVQSTDANGVSLTLNAFEAALPGVGTYVLMFSVLIFSVSSMFTFSYYGTKCLGFLIGAEYQHWYNYFYVAMVIFGSVASLRAIIGLIDGMYAVMAFPTMIAAILLAPKVKEAADDYFERLHTFEVYK